MIKQRKFDPTVPLLLHGTAGLESMSNLSVSDSRQDHGFRFVDSRQWWCPSRAPHSLAFVYALPVFVPLARRCVECRSQF